MNETRTPYGKPEEGSNIQNYRNDSWAIDYIEKEKSFHIRVTDYHADPLTISLEQLLRMARSKEVSKPKDPLIGINKRDKSLYIAIDEGWSGLLTMTRKELYRYGKQMSKRSSLKRHSLGKAKV